MNSGTQLTEEQKLRNIHLVLDELKKLTEDSYNRRQPADSTFVSELTVLINQYGLDNTYNIPDFILAEHLMTEIQNFNSTLIRMRKWHGWLTLGEKLDQDKAVTTAEKNMRDSTNETP